jgi:acyl-CoA synthetase (AMP-forming)/AMP-acid ligase II
MHGLNMDIPLLVTAMIDHAAQWHASTEVVARSIDGAIHRTTYGQSQARAKQLANALLALGIEDGDVLGSLAWNTQEHFELFYGVSGMGAVLHTINPRLFQDQIVYIADHARDKLIFCDAATLPIAEAIDGRLPGVAGWIFMGPEAVMKDAKLRNVMHYETLLAAQSSVYTWPQFDERHASSICYTSGTTGMPKGVVYTHRATTLSALIMSLADLIGGYQPGALEVVMPIAPLFHGNGWQMVYTAPMNGHKLVLPGRNFEPEKLLELINTEGVTIAAAVPTVWLTLLDHVDKTGGTLKPLRAALIAGSRPPDILLERLEKQHGVLAAQCWGMTEGLGVGKASIPPGPANRPQAAIDTLKRRQGRVGFGTQFRLVDDEGRDLPMDGTAAGKLLMRGHIVAGSYFRRPETASDWLDTGDIARIYGDGSLELVDRAKDVIKSGGEWISTLELESRAMQHLEVALAAAIAIPHPKWQERPLLAVVKRPGSTLDKAKMLAHMAETLAIWWLPDDVVFLDELPLTGTGKINKLRLRELLGGGGDLKGR